MSRNLCSSYCRSCSRLVTLNDLRGKPAEFRKYGSYAPLMGFRHDCPCGKVYFATFAHKNEFWTRESLASGGWKAPELTVIGQTYPNREAGKFVHMERDLDGREQPVNSGCFVIDLSFYESYNDEEWDEAPRQEVLRGARKPEYLCEGDASEHQWVWGQPRPEGDE